MLDDEGIAPGAGTWQICESVVLRNPGMKGSSIGPFKAFDSCKVVSEMLQLRPSCECCNKNLPPDSVEARICSFECTFCASCADAFLGGRCPNCGGELLARPRRPADKLAGNPPSTERIFNPAGCKNAAQAIRVEPTCATKPVHA